MNYTSILANSNHFEFAMKSIHGRVGPRPALRSSKIGRSKLIIQNIAEAQRSSSNGSGSLPSILSKVKSIQGKSPEADLSAKDAYAGVAYDVRDALIEKFNKTHAHWAVRHKCLYNCDELNYLLIFHVEILNNEIEQRVFLCYDNRQRTRSSSITCPLSSSWEGL